MISEDVCTSLRYIDCNDAGLRHCVTVSKLMTTSGLLSFLGQELPKKNVQSIILFVTVQKQNAIKRR